MNASLRVKIVKSKKRRVAPRAKAQAAGGRIGKDRTGDDR